MSVFSFAPDPRVPDMGCPKAIHRNPVGQQRARNRLLDSCAFRFGFRNVDSAECATSPERTQKANASYAHSRVEPRKWKPRRRGAEQGAPGARSRSAPLLRRSLRGAARRAFARDTRHRFGFQTSPLERPQALWNRMRKPLFGKTTCRTQSGHNYDTTYDTIYDTTYDTT